MLGAILPAVLSTVVSGLFNRSAAKEQMDFQAEMSNTSHQRQVRDLIAAGLNPMLSAKLGGASTPGGASATMPDLGATVSSAIQASRVQSEIKKLDADTATSKSQETLNEVSALKADAEKRLTIANAERLELENERERYLRSEWGKLGVEGEELSTRKVEAVYNNMMKNRDYNTIADLDSFAQKHGYHTFEAAIRNQKFLDDLQEYAKTKLQMPKERALSDFYQSEWGKEIAPYLNSANDAATLLGTGKGLLGVGKDLLSKPPVKTFPRR